MAQNDRYVALDRLRGVAALTVLLFHANEHFAGLFLPDSGYLAVDLILSVERFVWEHVPTMKNSIAVGMRAHF